MQITDIRVRKIENGGKMKAVVSITIDEDPSFQAEPDLYHLIVPPQRQTEAICPSQAQRRQTDQVVTVGKLKDHPSGRSWKHIKRR